MMKKIIFLPARGNSWEGAALHTSMNAQLGLGADPIGVNSSFSLQDHVDEFLVTSNVLAYADQQRPGVGIGCSIVVK